MQKYPPAVKRAVRVLLRTGLSQRETARKLGLSARGMMRALRSRRRSTRETRGRPRSLTVGQRKRLLKWLHARHGTFKAVSFYF